MFPNRIARNRVQPDRRFIKEKHLWPVQRGLRDFQTTHHAAGIFSNQSFRVGGEVHEFHCFRDARLLLAVRQVVKFGEDEQVLVTGERTVHGHRLRHITDGAANADRMVVMEKPATRASPEDGGNSVVSILIVVVLPAPLEPSKPKTSPALTESVSASTAVNVPKQRVRFLISRTTSLMIHSTKYILSVADFPNHFSALK